MSQLKSKQAPTQAMYTSGALFHGLRDREVSAMLNKATRADYPPRSWLYRQGDPAGRFFFVESGLVRLCRITPEGEDILVRFTKPGEVFGYYGLALIGPNLLSAQVIEPSQLVSWDREIALQLLQCVPMAAVNLFNIAVQDVVYFYNRSLRLMTQHAGRRVEWALSELVRTVGVSTPAGVVIAHGVGQRQLAELAGTTIFTVSRELTKLQRQGILEKQRGRIVVAQPAKLSDW